MKTIFQLIILVLAIQVARAIIGRKEPLQSQIILIALICLQTLIIYGYAFYLLTTPLLQNWVMPSKRKTVYTILEFLLPMAILEVFSFYLLTHPQKIPRTLVSSYADNSDHFDRSIITFNKGNARYDTDFFYMLKSDTTITFKNREFNTLINANSMGLRNDEASLKTPERWIA